MEMNELVSVIVPVYNVEKYLDRCIQSIVQQTYKNLEIIVVDDGSTDGCARILNDLKKSDYRIKVFWQENAGLSAARNTGIDNATGDYLLFVDSDDYINSQMIEILLGNLIDCKADISVCDLHWICEDESVEDFLENEISVYEGKGVLRKLIGDDVISVVAWNKLYKATLFEDIRYPVGRLHEDEYVIHKLLAKCKRSVYTKAKLYYYIKRAESISNKISSKNVIDATVALSQRLVWSMYVDDRVFSNWCFDNMLSEGYYTIKNFDSYENKEILCETRRYIKDALDQVAVNRAIDWRRIIIGYIWLLNPNISAISRRILYAFHFKSKV